jgi:hypothetical protein
VGYLQIPLVGLKDRHPADSLPSLVFFSHRRHCLKSCRLQVGVEVVPPEARYRSEAEVVERAQTLCRLLGLVVVVVVVAWLNHTDATMRTWERCIKPLRRWVLTLQMIPISPRLRQYTTRTWASPRGLVLSSRVAQRSPSPLVSVSGVPSIS